eukprot:1922674-Rhodomonas_salina.1
MGHRNDDADWVGGQIASNGVMGGANSRAPERLGEQDNYCGSKDLSRHTVCASDLMSQMECVCVCVCVDGWMAEGVDESAVRWVGGSVGRWLDACIIVRPGSCTADQPMKGGSMRSLGHDARSKRAIQPKPGDVIVEAMGCDCGSDAIVKAKEWRLSARAVGDDEGADEGRLRSLPHVRCAILSLLTSRIGGQLEQETASGWQHYMHIKVTDATSVDARGMPSPDMRRADARMLPRRPSKKRRRMRGTSSRLRRKWWPPFCSRKP